jgi:Guanylate kinase
VIRRRLENARNEIVNYPDYGYILVNEILEHAVYELQAIVLSERIRRSGDPVASEQRELFRIADGCLLANSHKKVQPVLDSFDITTAIRTNL